MTKRLQELQEKLRAAAEDHKERVLHAKQLDDAVKSLMAESDRIHRDAQTRLEHGVIDPSESARLHLDARLAMIDARLARLEGVIVMISKTSDASTSLLMDMFTSLAEAVSGG